MSSFTSSKERAMIGSLQTRVHKQPITLLYFEFETVLKFSTVGLSAVCDCGIS